MNSSIKNELEALLRERRQDAKRLDTGINPLTLETGYKPPDPYPPGVTQEELDAFCQNNQISLPPDLMAFLQISNGAPGFLGIGSAQEACNLEVIWESYPDWKQKNWIPVGRDDFGNYYVKPGTTQQPTPICFVEGTDSEVLQYAVASDMLKFARFKLEEQASLRSSESSTGWPFDKGFVLGKDPELASFGEEYVLPWDAE